MPAHHVKMDLRLKVAVILPPGAEVYSQADRIEAAARSAVLSVLEQNRLAGGFQSIQKDMRIETLGDEKPAPPLAEERALRAFRDKHPHAAMPRAEITLCGNPLLPGDIILESDVPLVHRRVPKCPECLKHPWYIEWAQKNSALQPDDEKPHPGPHAAMPGYTDSKENPTLCGLPPMVDDVVLHPPEAWESTPPRDVGCPKCRDDERFVAWQKSIQDEPRFQGEAHD